MTAHILILAILLLLESVRRAFIALIVDFFLIFVLSLGSYAICKVKMKLFFIFTIFLSILLVISLTAMIVEAFVITKKDERKFIFIIHSPLAADFLFLVAYICFYKKIKAGVVEKKKNMSI